MQVNENNTVIDMHRKGEAGHSQRYVSGPLTYPSSDKKTIKLWTPEGEKVFDVQSGRSQVSPLEEHIPWITQHEPTPSPRDDSPSARFHQTTCLSRHIHSRDARHE